MGKQGHAARDIRAIARKIFGYSELRAGQEQAIRAVLEGQDTLVVMPTGSGKSAIYQIAGQLAAGPTVIISPLIALQRDQVGALQEQAAGGAAMLNTTIKAADRREALEELRDAQLEFLFLAPEQLANAQLLERLLAARPSLFVIDEAHCISEWGHDFRPDYLRLGAVIEQLGHPRVLALTATAAPPVRQEIVERLGMRNPRIVVQGFDRPNIRLEVERFHDEGAKRQALFKRVRQVQGSGIIYVATRKHAEELAAELSAQGLPAHFYHGGMRGEERERAQQAFMHDEVPLIVATTAFGMGIDKPNVRFVFHYDISDSVDSYYQEIGRAGRDGAPARAIMFYRPADLGLRRFFAAGGQVDLAQLERVLKVLQAHSGCMEPADLLEATGLSHSRLLMVLNQLEEVEAVELPPGGPVRLLRPIKDLEAVLEEASGTQDRQRHYKQSRLEMMRGYAEVRDCRREYLLNYFGEEYDDPCNNCDNCTAGLVVLQEQSELPFPPNSAVTHQQWGPGQVMRYEGDKIVVLFDTVGYKTLSLELVLERGLLQAPQAGD